MELVVLCSFLLVAVGSLAALALNSRDEKSAADNIVRVLAIAVAVVILFEAGAWFARPLIASAVEGGIFNLNEWAVAIPLLLLFFLGKGRRSY